MKARFKLALLFLIGILTISSCAKVEAIPRGQEAAAAAGTEFTQDDLSDKQLLESLTIYRGVSVGGIDLEGLNIISAEEKIKENLSPILEETLTLTHGDNNYTYTLKELGYVIDYEGLAKEAYSQGRTGDQEERLEIIASLEENPVDIPYDVSLDNQDNIDSLVQAVANELNKTPAGATYSYDFDSGNVIASLPESGQKVETELLAQSIIENPNQGTIQIPISLIEADPDAQAKADSVNGVIGRSETTFNQGFYERAKNIEISTNELNGYVLGPGDTFSYNAIMGDTTLDKGYLEAIVIDENDEQVPGMGGGVCQTTTALYHAVLRGGLEIINRVPHTLYMPYSPGGLDAAVEYGSADLAFRNPYDFPIVIRSYHQPGHISFEILGNVENSTSYNIWSEKSGDMTWTAYKTNEATGETINLGSTTYKGQ